MKLYSQKCSSRYLELCCCNCMRVVRLSTEVSTQRVCDSGRSRWVLGKCLKYSLWLKQAQAIFIIWTFLSHFTSDFIADLKCETCVCKHFLRCHYFPIEIDSSWFWIKGNLTNRRREVVLSEVQMLRPTSYNINTFFSHCDK